MSNDYIEPSTLQDIVIGKPVCNVNGVLTGKIIRNAWEYREYLLSTDEEGITRPSKGNTGAYKYVIKYPVIDGGMLRSRNNDSPNDCIMMDKLKKRCNLCTSKCKKEKVCGLFNTLVAKEYIED